MKFVLSVLAASSLAFCQQLSVPAASAKRVNLAWTGVPPDASVERRSGADPFKDVGMGSGGAFADEKIAPFATYQYRVRAAGGMVSNVVTVGPPPLGVSVAARVPKGLDPEKFGVASAISLDENGDPALAFVWVDPNNDRKNDDTGIYFSRWNRAAYAWKAPVLVEVAGDIATKDSEPVAMAFEASSGVFAVAYWRDNQSGVRVTLSRDFGATWEATSVLPEMEGTISSIAMAAGNGKWFLAAKWNRGFRLLSGAAADAPANWKSQTPPEGKIDANIGLAIDKDGEAFVAYWAKPDKGDNKQVFVWSPDTGKAEVAADSNNQDCDDTAVRLNLAGGVPRVLLNCDRDPKDDRKGLWFTAKSSDKWSEPVKLPVDGPRSTSSPLALAVSSKGALAAIYASSSGGGDTGCGYPVVARSTDGAHWTACGIGKRAVANFEKAASSVGALFTPDDRLNLLWHEEHDERDNKFGPGLLVWRE